MEKHDSTRFHGKPWDKKPYPYTRRRFVRSVGVEGPMRSLQELAMERMQALHLSSVSEAAHVVFIAEQVILEMIASLQQAPDCTYLTGTLKIRVPHAGLAHLIHGMQMHIIRECNQRLRKPLIKKIKISIGQPLPKERDWEKYERSDRETWE